MFVGGISAFEQSAVTIRFSAGVSASPITNRTGPIGWPIVVSKFGIALICGESLTGVTVSRNVLVATFPAASRHITVICEVPNWSGFGRKRNVLSALVPLNSNASFATRLVLEDRPLTVRVDGGPSGSS